VLSVLPFTNSDYPFGIFKFFYGPKSGLPDSLSSRWHSIYPHTGMNSVG